MSMASSPSRPRLSVAMIVKNEQANLPAALASIRQIADEVVIVDTGSTDGTRQIAQQHQAKIIDHGWRDDISAARNAGLSACSGDWILWLDAGERLPADQAKAVRELVNQADRRKAWLLYIEVPPAVASGAAERVARIRLLPNLPGLQFIGRVRETPRASILALGLTPELAPITIYRSVREHDPAVKHDRARRDLQLLDRAIPEQGPQPTLLNALGECHATLGNPVAAAQYFQQALRAANPGSTEMLEAYYGLLTTFEDQQYDRRLDTCLEALDRFPFDAQLLCAMGNYLHSQNRIDLSCRAYQSAVQVGQVNPETWHLVEIGEVAAVCLSTIWQLQGQDDKAREVLQEAAGRMAHTARVRRNLIELEVKYGRVLEALGEAEKLPADFPHREAYRSAIRGGCQAARKNWVPAIAYLETAYNAGCRDALCMRWLTASLMATERHAEARPIVLEWQLLEPTSHEVQRFVVALNAPSAATTLPATAAHASPITPAGLRVRIDQPQDAHQATPQQQRSQSLDSRPRG